MQPKSEIMFLPHLYGLKHSKAFPVIRGAKLELQRYTVDCLSFEAGYINGGSANGKIL